jgi:hypothetical protein
MVANFEYLMAQFTPAQQAVAEKLMSNYRNQVDERKQMTGKRQYILENVHSTALQTLISDSVNIVDFANNALQKNLDWLHWEFFISEITGRVEGMVICDPEKLLNASRGISDVRLVRFNPDAGKIVTVDMQKGITAVKGDVPKTDPGLNVTAGNMVPYGLVLQCAVTLPDSGDTLYQIDDMGNIELNDALQACYNAIGHLHDAQAVERLAAHILLMRCLKQLKYNAYEDGEFFDALHSLYNGYFQRKQAHDETLRAHNRRHQREGLTETELNMRALMTPENVHKAQQKLAYSLEKRNMKSDTKVIDFQAFQQARFNEDLEKMFEPDHPDNW